MVKYSQRVERPEKVAKSCAKSLRCHFKHTREICTAIRGMTLTKAISYLENVLEFKEAVPFRRFMGGCGRHAQAKNLKAPGSQVKWPQKASTFILGLLKNAEANATNAATPLDVEKLVVKHIQSNRARKMRRRTYRAHGRITPYMSNPAHIELIVEEEAEKVEKADDGKKARLTRKQLAQRRLKSGGGV